MKKNQSLHLNDNIGPCSLSEEEILVEFGTNSKDIRPSLSSHDTGSIDDKGPANDT